MANDQGARGGSIKKHQRSFESLIIQNRKKNEALFLAHFSDKRAHLLRTTSKCHFFSRPVKQEVPISQWRNMGFRIHLLVLKVSLLATIVEGWFSPSFALSSRPMRRATISTVEQQQSSSSHNDDAQLPSLPQVWIFDETSLNDDADCYSPNDWKSHSINDHVAAFSTHHWTRRDDCPLWANGKAPLSQDNSEALQLFLVDSKNLCEDSAIHVVEHVASQLCEFITRCPTLESTATFLVVFTSFDNSNESKNNNDEAWWGDVFSDFNEWFVEANDEIWNDEIWDKDDTIRLTPFHPGWPKLEEKRAPYPTIALASTKIESSQEITGQAHG